MEPEALKAYLVVLAVGMLFGAAAGLRWATWKTPVVVTVLSGVLPFALVAAWTALLAAVGALSSVVLLGMTGKYVQFSSKFWQYFDAMFGNAEAGAWYKLGGFVLVTALTSALVVWLRRRGIARRKQKE